MACPARTSRTFWATSVWTVGRQTDAGLPKLLVGFEDKSATALCTFAFSPGPGEEPILFEGTTAGKIVVPRGATRFGWDPVFEVDETSKTFAEMDGTEKNKVSHRGRALAKLQAYLAEH